jgi:hypothetical protein
MESIYIVFMAVIGIIMAIGVGMQLSSEIDEFIIYVLFWMLYTITIVTFVNIILVGNYYLSMKNKTGPPGKQGKSGKRGTKGDTGLCDATCRDMICENSINEMILKELTDRNNGKPVKINNVYLKSKVRLICGSDEFKKLAPYNGPYNLINYLKSIWEIWFNLLYEAGGLSYFENVGAETDFEWLGNNPFDELKKYDIFYWGMGKQYRPKIVDKCYTKDEINNSKTDSKYIVKASASNYYDSLGNDSGSGAFNNVSFWRAKQFAFKGNTYYPVGDVAIGPNRRNDNVNSARTVGVYQLPGSSGGPLRSTIIVAGDVKGPVDYQLIWTNSRFWLWRPIPPTGYITMGDIVTFNSNKPNTNDGAPIRCVPQDITIKMKNNNNIFWSSLGSGMPNNVSILGFIPNDGGATEALPENAYNLFKAVNGNNLQIPSTDVNGSFYSLDENSYASNFVIGLDVNDDTNATNEKYLGKGYIDTPQKDAKYSVLAYLHLKNNVVLTHNMTQTKYAAQLIPNAISNAYLIKINNDKNNTKCMEYSKDKLSFKNECDDNIDNQIFSIILTGNKKDECRIQHFNSKKFLRYKNGGLSLINNNSDIEFTLFMMD